MKWAHSLRLRVTLWCALLLTLCCTALAVTSNLSAIQLADSIAAVPLYPAQTAPGLDAEMPLTLVSPRLLRSSRPGSFSQNAAHEFRTPMAVLKTRIGLFRKKQDFAPQTTEEFLRILEDEVDRLSGMVDSLLKLTSLEQVPRTDRIELSELLHQVTEDVSSLFSGKGMHISTEAAPGSIQGSRELLRRALFNLVENAVKYGPEGGEVQIHAEPDGANAAITVSDQGPRIPPELRERIFEPFFRLDTARSRDLGGTGLGLALVRAIAEVHGGSVSVEEGPAGGNQFLLRLPAESP